MNGETSKRPWERIEIRYDDGTFVDIRKEDLDKIKGIEDVIDALLQAKDLVAKLQNILK